MKKIIMTIVSVIMTANMIVSGNVMSAKAEDVKEVKSVAEAVDWLKQVDTEGYVEKTVYVNLDNRNSIYFRYEYNVEDSRYEFTQCRVYDNRFVGWHVTDYFYY